jgi:phage terminase Nu1 subunit (DNA packaging protein)
MIVDRTTLAEVFEVSPDTVRAWQKAGMPHFEPENRKGTREQRKVHFSTRAAHEWLVQRATRRRWC